VAGRPVSTHASTATATPSNAVSTRLKQWRGIATRYDKYALTYLGGVTLAAIVLHHHVRS